MTGTIKKYNTHYIYVHMLVGMSRIYTTYMYINFLQTDNLSTIHSIFTQ